MPWPSIAVLGQDFNGSIVTTAGTGSPVDADALPTYSIYEDGTNTAILTGSYAKLDDAGTTGYYQIEIECTAANGFERFKSYHVKSSATIATTVVGTTDSFIVFGSSDVFTASTGALTTTANFKTYAGISGTTNDSLIAALIARATSAIQKHCDRDFISTTYRELHDGGGREVFLENYPIISVQMFSEWRQNAMQLVNTSTDAYNAYVQINDTTITLVVQGGTNAGSNAITLDDYATLTLLKTAIEALAVGWSVTLISGLEKWDPIELLPVSGLNCYTNSVTLDVPDAPRSDYRIDNDTGIISDWYCGDGFYDACDDDYAYEGRRRINQVTVRYTAGYATTPGDLEQICIDLTKLYYDGRTQSGSLESEKIGDYSYKLGIDGAMVIPKGLQDRLTAWRRHSL